MTPKDWGNLHAFISAHRERKAGKEATPDADKAPSFEEIQKAAMRKRELVRLEQALHKVGGMAAKIIPKKEE